MITAELAQRCLVQLEQNLAELLGVRIAGCETLAVHFAQCANEGVSVFGADFSVLVAVAIVESGLGHTALHCTRAHSMHRPRPNRNNGAREMPLHCIALGGSGPQGALLFAFTSLAGGQ